MTCWTSTLIYTCRGEAWHRLRQEDFSQVDNGLETLSEELQTLVRSMMRMDPAVRIEITLVASHPVVSRAREAMEEARKARGDVFAASPLGSCSRHFLDEILQRPPWMGDDAMDLGY